MLKKRAHSISRILSSTEQKCFTDFFTLLIQIDKLISSSKKKNKRNKVKPLEKAYIDDKNLFLLSSTLSLNNQINFRIIYSNSNNNDRYNSFNIN